MAEIGRSHVWKAREDMSLPDHRRPLPERLKGKAPVRVKLEPINCDVSRSLPPEGDRQVWLDRLMAALGTSSIEFVDATLYQLQAAARLPNSGVSEIAVNASLAFIEGERPRGEMECAIVVQLACLHAASMNVLGRLSAAWGHRNVLAAATAASRLSRSFAVLVETLRRQRSGGSQIIRIERVDVRNGGQAVFGNIRSENYLSEEPK